LTKRKSIVREIKSRRIAWLRNLERTEKHRLIKKITEQKLIYFMPRGRPKMRWEEYVKHHLKVMKINNWKKQTKSRNEWKRIIEQAKTHKELQRRRRRILTVSTKYNYWRTQHT
jgi:hypothetical protein